MTITSRQNPLVARFRTAARGDVGGVMLLDGAHLIADALAAAVVFQLAAVTPASIGEDADIRALIDLPQRSGVEVITVSASVMDAVSPVKTPSGIVALAERPAASAACTALPRWWSRRWTCQDPGNLGAIVRVAEAAGATGFVAAGGSANPFGWKALRGSMGSALRLPIISEVSADAGGRRSQGSIALPASSRRCRATDARCSRSISRRRFTCSSAARARVFR